MQIKIILTGDVNLMNADDPAVPFARVADEFARTDVVFSNLECCFYDPPGEHSIHREGFFAQTGNAVALRRGHIDAVGLANNVNYGEDAILSSIARLDALGIPHTGAGAHAAAAYAPVVLERQGARIGILQRTAVYWPINHEAASNAAGVAVIRGHTAYQVPLYKERPESMPLNRPGVAPVIVTWADARYLKRFCDEIRALKAQTDFVVASIHWGLDHDVLEYMTEIAHAAIDAGADAVMGHGPHYSLAVECYRGKPVFYGLGSFSFHTGHGGIKSGDWVGMLARIGFDSASRTITRAAFQFVRHSDSNESVLCELAAEGDILAEVSHASAAFGTRLRPEGDEVVLDLAASA